MWLSFPLSKPILIVALISSLTSTSTYAQEKDPSRNFHSIRLGVGFSAVGILSDLVNYLRVIDGVDMDKYPVLEATYMHPVLDRVSFGGGVGFQHFALTYRDPSSSSIQSYGLVANRINIGVQGFYYYAQNSTLSLYSGARLGFSNWNVDTETGFPIDALDRIINFALGGALAPQVILIGAETLFTNHIGLHGEVAIGAPHVLLLGLNYRW